MPYKKETVRICVRHNGEKRNAARGEKQEFPGNLPGTAVLGPLHDGGEKFLVPVFGEDKKGLINDLLCASVRAALCQPEYCCQQPQFEGADVLRRGPEPGEVVVVGVAAAHGAGGAVGGDAVLSVSTMLYIRRSASSEASGSAASRRPEASTRSVSSVFGSLTVERASPTSAPNSASRWRWASVTGAERN